MKAPLTCAPALGGRPLRRYGSALVAVLLLLAGSGVPARAAVVTPRLELFSPRDSFTLFRYGKRQPVYVQLGLRLASRDAPFELMARRSDYLTPPALFQVLHGPNGEREEVPLDPAFMNGWLGLKDFFEISFTDPEGREVVSISTPFCPGNYDRERVSDAGPAQPSYPSGCYTNPFTKGVVWGIDQDWAVSVDAFEAPSVSIPNGIYSVTASIADDYVQEFGIAPEMATATMAVRVRTARNCRRGPCGGHGPMPHGSAAHRRYSSVPTMTDPDPAILPDLIPLPSWGIGVRNRGGKARLTFGATVWTAGASDLVVEGFRRGNEAVMDGYQYFYRDGEAIGKAPAGELEYDERRGHNHWHFKQFAAYSLLNADQSQVLMSTKEAFCLASTDAVDLTLPAADLDPYIGLSTACGQEGSIWVREVLPLGWGDTYHQSVPGQSFNITDLPNGRYFIKVEANPGGRLYEQRHDNNVELREVILKGRPGHRRAVVPPWNGIDSESGRSGGGGFFSGGHYHP